MDLWPVVLAAFLIFPHEELVGVSLTIFDQADNENMLLVIDKQKSLGETMFQVASECTKEPWSRSLCFAFR